MIKTNNVCTVTVTVTCYTLYVQLSVKARWSALAWRAKRVGINKIEPRQLRNMAPGEPIPYVPVFNSTDAPAMSVSQTVVMIDTFSSGRRRKNSRYLREVEKHVQLIWTIKIVYPLRNLEYRRNARLNN